MTFAAMPGFAPGVRVLLRAGVARVAEPAPGWDALVCVEAAAALAAEVSRRHHPPEERAGAVLRIAESFAHQLENRETDVEADEIGQRQRPIGWFIPSFITVSIASGVPTPSMTA
jgi:hypothetical protein